MIIKKEIELHHKELIKARRSTQALSRKLARSKRGGVAKLPLRGASG